MKKYLMLHIFMNLMNQELLLGDFVLVCFIYIFAFYFIDLCFYGYKALRKIGWNNHLKKNCIQPNNNLISMLK